MRISRRALFLLAGMVVLAAMAGLGWGGYLLVERYFLRPTQTSFTATVTTTTLQFTAGTPGGDENDAGFLAPTRPLAIEVLGCSQLESQDRAEGDAAVRVACEGRRIRLAHVRLASLALGNGDKVTAFVEDGRLHVRVPGTAAAVLEGVDGSEIVGGTSRQKLEKGEWRVAAANVGLELIFAQQGPVESEAHAKEAGGASAWAEGVLVKPDASQAGGFLVKPAESDAAKVDSALPAETESSVQDGSQVLFESRGRSALMGDDNALNIARVKDHISLKDSRLELKEVHAGKIRHLHVAWDVQSGFHALQLTVSGTSDELLTYAMYSEAGGKDASANEALSWFDKFAAGRRTRSLVGGATVLAAVPTLLVAVVNILNGVLDLRQKTQGGGGNHGRGLETTGPGSVGRRGGVRADDGGPAGDGSGGVGADGDAAV